MLNIKKIIIGFIISILVINIVVPKQADAAAKKYAVLVGDWAGNYQLFDNLTTTSPKGNLMIKAKSFCDKMKIGYKYDKDTKCVTIHAGTMRLIVKLGNKNFTIEEHYDQQWFVLAERTANYKCYYDKTAKCIVLEAAALDNFLNYSYFSSSKAPEFKKLGYTGILMYSEFDDAKSVPKISELRTEITPYNQEINVKGEDARYGVAGEIVGIGIHYDMELSMEENINNLYTALYDNYGDYWHTDGLFDEPSFQMVFDEEEGEAAFIIRFWRNSYKSDDTLNVTLNMVLETFRFFAGDEAGNDLWQFTDKWIIFGEADVKDFGFTLEDNDTLMVHKNGCKIGYSEYSDSFSYIFSTK